MFRDRIFTTHRTNILLITSRTTLFRSVSSAAEAHDSHFSTLTVPTSFEVVRCYYCIEGDADEDRTRQSPMTFQMDTGSVGCCVTMSVQSQRSPLRAPHPGRSCLLVLFLSGKEIWHQAPWRHGDYLSLFVILKAGADVILPSTIKLSIQYASLGVLFLYFIS